MLGHRRLFEGENFTMNFKIFMRMVALTKEFSESFERIRNVMEE